MKSSACSQKEKNLCSLTEKTKGKTKKDGISRCWD
jgi:hypothetical protein